MLFFHRKDFFQHSSRGWIVTFKVVDRFPVTVDRHSFSDEVLFDHSNQRDSLNVLRVTSSEEPFRRKVWFSTDLYDSPRKQVGMGLFLIRVFEEFLGYAASIQTGGH